VLHTPRGGGLEGRYESPPMTRDQVEFLLGSHKPFLTRDARHDLWVGDEHGNLLVWDRHDVLFAYGFLPDFEAALRQHGYSSGGVTIPSPHQHSYDPRFDDDEGQLLADVPWQRQPLQAGDQQ